MDDLKGKSYLHIDLTHEQYEIRKTDLNTTGNYPSGIALATFLLSVTLPAGTDPMSPDNVLVFAPGMFAGTPYPGATRVAIASKSPLTGLWAGGTMGGGFAWALSQTGWDAVVIQGRASSLSYLLLDEGRVFFRNARDIEGCFFSETRRKLEETWGEDAGVLCIGPAGESQMKFANLQDGFPEASVRGGMGAVFGAKNLKALVVRPYVPINTGKAEAFLEAVLPSIKGARETESAHSFEMQTPHALRKLNHLDALPSRNFQAAGFSEEWFNALESLDTQKRSCPGCPYACIYTVLSKEDSERPENRVAVPIDPEHLWALGPLLDVTELDESLKTLRACQEYGIAPVSLGILAAWMAECREKNIDLGIGLDLEPKFGDGSWLPGLPGRITENPVIRDVLARGVSEAAKRIGPGSEVFAMHFCGEGLSFIDLRRGFWPLSFLGPAVLIPAQNNGFPSDYWLTADGNHKMIQVENHWALLESIGICKRVGMAQRNFHENLLPLCQLVSVHSGAEEFVKEWGEKCVKLIQAFNWREGWRPQHLCLPKRFLQEELATPQHVYPALDAGRWLECMKHYFTLRGWSAEGDPGDTQP